MKPRKRHLRHRGLLPQDWHAHAVLRSADASGVDAVVVCDPLTDLYNPNLIRSSVGAAFTVPCVACSSEECIAFLKQRNIKILTAQLQDSHLYYDTDMTCSTAIVMGTEHDGLTDQWRQAADAHSPPFRSQARWVWTSAYAIRARPSTRAPWTSTSTISNTASSSI